MTILVANREARRLLSLGSAEAGRPLREAELALRPLDLRTPIERVLRRRQPLRVPDVACETGPDAPVVLDLIISPLESLSAVEIALVDVTRYQHLRDELEQSQRELESAYEELQSAVEELETTNEELQSTNEELETTNEELHSTNEELETMNEELQSTNEELETINNELRVRSGEVDQLNDFLQTILGSLESAVIVLDTGMQVQAWNRQAEELWGLRGDEVIGQHFLNLDIGFPVDTLRNPIRAGLSGNEDLQHLSGRAVNRRGRPIDCAVDISTLVAEEGIRGVLILMNATPAELEASTPRSPQGNGPVGHEGEERDWPARTAQSGEDASPG
jgi:two-component system CheB/CheR fusion protein